MSQESDKMFGIKKIIIYFVIILFIIVGYSFAKIKINEYSNPAGFEVDEYDDEDVEENDDSDIYDDWLK